MLLSESLTAHFVPFRSPGIESLHNKRASFSFSESLWAKILEFIHPKVLVVIDRYAFKRISRVLEKGLGQSPNIDLMPIGWGNCDASVQDFSLGPTLCRFPHWSTYKIFSHAESQRPVGEIVDVLAKKLKVIVL